MENDTSTILGDAQPSLWEEQDKLINMINELGSPIDEWDFKDRSKMKDWEGWVPPADLEELDELDDDEDDLDELKVILDNMTEKEYAKYKAEQIQASPSSNAEYQSEQEGNPELNTDNYEDDENNQPVEEDSHSSKSKGKKVEDEA